MKDARVTISRTNHDEIFIKIDDDTSGLRVVEVMMSPSDFARAITGLSSCNGEFHFTPTAFTAANIGKVRETDSFFVRKSDGYSKEAQAAIVYEEFEKSGLAEAGWMIHSDGTGSQQPHDTHRATIYRFV
jgi:hypothetical protein